MHFCVFCGNEISNKSNDFNVCISPLNSLVEDTTGKKYHAYVSSYSDKAKQAANRARVSGNSEIEFFDLNGRIVEE